MSPIIESEYLSEVLDEILDDKFDEIKEAAALYHEWGDDPGYVEGVRELAAVVSSLKPGEQVFEVEIDTGAFCAWYWFVGASEEDVAKRLKGL